MFQRGHGEGGDFSGIGVGPVGGDDAGGGVWRVSQGVVVLRPVAGFDLGDFRADGNHGVGEAVQLGQRLAFGGLDHQRSGHGEAEGGGVKAVVHQAFGLVFGGHAAGSTLTSLKAARAITHCKGREPTS